MSEFDGMPCNREWEAEGLGLLACDLRPGHDGPHQSNYRGEARTADDLDALEFEEVDE